MQRVSRSASIVASWSTVYFSTADFGLSAQNPSNTAIAVESLI